MNKDIHGPSPVYSQIGHMCTGLACTAADLLVLHAMACRPSTSSHNAYTRLAYRPQ